ncbi:hypothetical protein IF2G_10998 [Cordyceps javanica]|nr:hypothetical protein IF2G_10998 [Cordyceps javanica]
MKFSFVHNASLPHVITPPWDLPHGRQPHSHLPNQACRSSSNKTHLDNLCGFRPKVRVVIGLQCALGESVCIVVLKMRFASRIVAATESMVRHVSSCLQRKSKTACASSSARHDTNSTASIMSLTSYITLATRKTGFTVINIVATGVAEAEANLVSAVNITYEEILRQTPIAIVPGHTPVGRRAGGRIGVGPTVYNRTMEKESRNRVGWRNDWGGFHMRCSYGHELFSSQRCRSPCS